VTVWLDNQLPPALASWLRSTRSVECVAVRELNLQRASDVEIFTAARALECARVTLGCVFVEPDAP
jgi:predicted nuclease of predicted toxin-antitoxin system